MEFSLVDDADSLALGSGNGLGGDQVDLGADTQHGPHCAIQLLFVVLHIGDLVGELFGRELDVDIEGIGVVDTVDHDLVVGGVAFFEQNGFDLAREDIDTANDHHIVGTAHRLVHPDKGASAGALLS